MFKKVGSANLRIAHNNLERAWNRFYNEELGVKEKCYNLRSEFKKILQ